MIYFEIYLILINVLAIIVWCVDKYRAAHGKWRISERALFLLALLGGSPGCLLAMHAIRHKTRHWYFVLGIPLILVLQAAVIIFFIVQYNAVVAAGSYF